MQRTSTVEERLIEQPPNVFARRSGPEPLRTARPDRILIKSGARIVFVSVDDVQWVESEGNYARLHVASEAHLVRATMRALQARLGAARFARIHRSRIARLDCIHELRVSRDGQCSAVLRDGTRLKVGRAFREVLQDRLKLRPSEAR